MRHARLAAAVCSSALLAFAVGGCGSSSKSSEVSAPAGSPPPSTTSGGVTSGATGSTSSTPSTTTTAGSSPGACVASELELRYLGQQGAAGHGELGFALRNTGTTTCRTFGYPGVQFLDKSGAPLPTKPIRVKTDLAGSAPAAELHLAPGVSASFRLFVTHGAVPNSVCTTAYGLQAIAPDDTASVRAAIPGGAYECGDATVIPLQPGTSAFSTP